MKVFRVVKSLVILCLIAVIHCSLYSRSAAQSSPAFDPNVYLPQLGTPGEFDTLHVSGTQGNLGSTLVNIGPAPGGSYGRMLISGLPSDPPFLSMVETGHDFDLGNLHVLKDLHFNFPGKIIERAHIHRADSWDLVVAQDRDFRIYWEQADGGYDTSEYVYLRSPRKTQYVAEIVSNLYVAHLVSDTVDDLILLGSDNVDTVAKDSVYIILYRGGEHLYQQGHVAFGDSLQTMHPEHGQAQVDLWRTFSSGDWRGTGRNDAIGYWIDQNGELPHPWYYYRNDPPFTMKKFARAMMEDTLFDPKDSGNSGYSGSPLQGEFQSFRALPKTVFDTSEDLLLSVGRADDPTLEGSVYIFKGGPDFGTHHLTLKNAAVLIPNPKHLDPAFQHMAGFGRFQNQGDMTGTGRPVLFLFGGEGFDGYNFFYVLGDAADGLVDAFFYNMYGTSGDSLTADHDSREDVLISNLHDQTLYLLHGSSRIPVEVHYRDLKPQGTGGGARAIDIWPNPARDQISVSVQSEETGPVQLTIRNVLGQSVVTRTVRLPPRRTGGRTDPSSGAPQWRIHAPARGAAAASFRTFDRASVS